MYIRQKTLELGFEGQTEFGPLKRTGIEENTQCTLEWKLLGSNSRD